MAKADPVLENYMRDMTRRYPGRQGISAAEEAGLAQRAIRGDAAAQARLVETHLAMVFEIAKRFRATAKKMDFLDLIQEGNQGLMRAAKKFRAGHGRFSRYAAESVKWRILEVLRRGRNFEAVSVSFLENSRRFSVEAPAFGRNEDNAVLVGKLLGFMSERSRIMVAMRFGLYDGNATSVTEIAKRFGIDRSAASIAMNRALRKAKAEYEAGIKAAV